MNLERQRQKVDELQHLSQTGRLGQARALLGELSREKLDRRLAFGVAAVARRARMPEKALQILHRIVRPPPGSRAVLGGPPTPRETAEYGMALAELGALREGIELLQSVPTRVLPTARLLEALAHIRRWDRASARQSLNRMMAVPGLGSYDRVGALLYLASCTLHGDGRLADAAKELEAVASQANELGYGELYRSALLLRVQALTFARQVEQARALLAELRTLAEQAADPRAVTLCSKWEMLAALQVPSERRSALRRVPAIRAEMLQQRQWDRIRAMELYLAMDARDVSKMSELIAGTPYPVFRARAVGLLVRWGARAPTEYAWSPPPARGSARSDAPPVIVHARDGTHSLGSSFLKPGQVPQRLLQCLAGDFYKPLTVAEVHEAVYPGEFFNPSSSPLRIHQALWRLRKWTEDTRIPLAVEEELGFYCLRATAPCRIQLSLAPASAPRASPGLLQTLETVRTQLGLGKFGATELARAACVSRPTAVRYLAEALRAGLVEREGRGPATRYRFGNTGA